MPRSQSYSDWEKRIERQVETQFRQLKTKRAAEGNPVKADHGNIGSARRKRLLGLFRELSRLSTAIESIGEDVLQQSDQSREEIRLLRPLLNNIREGSETAWRLAYYSSPAIFDGER